MGSDSNGAYADRTSEASSANHAALKVRIESAEHKIRILQKYVKALEDRLNAHGITSV